MTVAKRLRVLTYAEVDELVAVYRSGLNLTQSAKRLGIHRATAQRILGDRGVLREPLTVNGELAGQLASGYLAGMTFQELAAEFSISATTCGRVLHKLGIAMRPQARRGRQSPAADRAVSDGLLS